MTTIGNKYVQKCIVNALDIDNGPGTPSLWDHILSQNVADPNSIGGDFMTKDMEELSEMLFYAEWEEVKNENIEAPKKVFTANIKGHIGMCDIDMCPEGTVFYALDPKNTGNIIVGATNIPKTETKTAYLITTPDVVLTVAPGELTVKKAIPCNLKHGTPLTKEQVIDLGFDKVKYISREVEKQFEEEHVSGTVANAFVSYLNNGDIAHLRDAMEEAKADTFDVTNTVKIEIQGHKIAINYDQTVDEVTYRIDGDTFSYIDGDDIKQFAFLEDQTDKKLNANQELLVLKAVLASDNPFDWMELEDLYKEINNINAFMIEIKQLGNKEYEL